MTLSHMNAATAKANQHEIFENNFYCVVIDDVRLFLQPNF